MTTKADQSQPWKRRRCPVEFKSLSSRETSRGQQVLDELYERAVWSSRQLFDRQTEKKMPAANRAQVAMVVAKLAQYLSTRNLAYLDDLEARLAQLENRGPGDADALLDLIGQMQKRIDELERKV